MRFTPGTPNDKITKTYFTEGGEYMNLSGVEYRGFIHKIGRLFFSGKSHTDESFPVLPWNSNPIYLTYLKNKGWFFNNFTDPQDFLPSPTEKDYKAGFIERYFLKKRNEVQSRIIEVDKNQFKSLENLDVGVDGNRFFGISFNWNNF